MICGTVMGTEVFAVSEDGLGLLHRLNEMDKAAAKTAAPARLPVADVRLRPGDWRALLEDRLVTVVEVGGVRLVSLTDRAQQAIVYSPRIDPVTGVPALDGPELDLPSMAAGQPAVRTACRRPGRRGKRGRR